MVGQSTTRDRVKRGHRRAHGGYSGTRWENGIVVRFRYNAAITVAAVVVLLGAVPLATSRWYLAPLLVIPLLVAVWGWRAGTDANATGVRARALFGSRFLPWSRVDSLEVGDRNRVYARTTANSALL